LRYLEFPDNQKVEVDLRSAVAVVLANLDRLSAQMVAVDAAHREDKRLKDLIWMGQTAWSSKEEDVNVRKLDFRPRCAAVVAEIGLLCLSEDRHLHFISNLSQEVTILDSGCFEISRLSGSPDGAHALAACKSGHLLQWSFDEPSAGVGFESAKLWHELQGQDIVEVVAGNGNL